MISKLLELRKRMVGSTRRIGSPFFWLFARCVETSLAGVCLGLVIFRLRAGTPDVTMLLLVAGLLGCAFGLWRDYSLASVQANQDGIFARLFFRRRFIPWSNVAGIEYGGFLNDPLTFHLRTPLSPVIGGRRVEALDVTSLKHWWKLIFRREEPEIIAWVREQIAKNRPAEAFERLPAQPLPQPPAAQD